MNLVLGASIQLQFVKHIHLMKNLGNFGSRSSLPFFSVTTLGHCWVLVDDALALWAALVVVVDDAARLQMGIDGDGANVFEAPPLQVLADLCRKGVAHRDAPVLVPSVENGLVVGERPDVLAEAAEIFSNFLITPRVVDDRFHFATGLDHALGGEDTFHIGFVEAGDGIVVEIREASPEDLALLEHQDP